MPLQSPGKISIVGTETGPDTTAIPTDWTCRRCNRDSLSDFREHSTYGRQILRFAP